MGRSRCDGHPLDGHRAELVEDEPHLVDLVLEVRLRQLGRQLPAVLERQPVEEPEPLAAQRPGAAPEEVPRLRARRVRIAAVPSALAAQELEGSAGGRSS